MAVEYHYSRGDKSFGPVSVEQLRQLAASGEIAATDLVWREGLSEWVPASRLKGLIPPAAPNATAAAAPAAAPLGAATPTGATAPAAPALAAPAAMQQRTAGLSNAAPAVFVPSSDSEHEFRLSESAPPQPPTFELPTARPAAASELPNDTTQAEIFARQAKEVALAAGSDALKAFKILAKNPIGGLRPAYENLGPSRAMQVGIVFASAFALTAVFAGHFALVAFAEARRGAGLAPPSTSIMDYVKLALIGCVPFGCAVGGFAIVRAICKTKGTIQANMFVAGAALVPAVILIWAADILGVLNFEITLSIAVFAATTTVMLLYSGLTTLEGAPEVAATIAIPLIFLADIYVAKIIAVM